MSKQELDPRDARMSYNYLRLGLVGSAFLLGVAILIEIGKTTNPSVCTQTSISGYYYTPVRAIFVGALVAIGLLLMVIKGAVWEDLALNVAGLLAPIVAFVPTVNVGTCFSIPPEPLPLELNPDGKPKEPFEIANWVLRNIENNMRAYLLVTLGGVILGAVLYRRRGKSVGKEPASPSSELVTRISIAAFALIVVAGLIALYQWPDFNTTSHNVAAIGMFGSLAVAAIINGITDRKSRRGYARWYLLIGLLMILVSVGILLVFKESFGGFHVFWVEVSEIGLFIVYWVLQTIDHWFDRVDPSGVGPAPGVART